MFERFEYSIADIQRRLRNMVMIGTVEEVKPKGPSYDAKVNLGGKDLVTDWLSVVNTASDLWLPLNKGDQVVILNTGDINSSLILGTIKKEADLHGKKDEITLRRQSKVSFDVDKFEVKSGGDELISLLIEALEVISDSKTLTFNGPQPLLPAKFKLKRITRKLKEFTNAKRD